MQEMADGLSDIFLDEYNRSESVNKVCIIIIKKIKF